MTVASGKLALAQGQGRTYLDEGICLPASQLLAGRVPHSSPAARGGFQLEEREKSPGSCPDRESQPPPLTLQPRKDPLQQLPPGASRLTLWRWCVGPAPSQGQLPGQGGAVLSVGRWGRTGAGKAQGAGAARPADGRGPGDRSRRGEVKPQPHMVRVMPIPDGSTLHPNNGSHSGASKENGLLTLLPRAVSREQKTPVFPWASSDLWSQSLPGQPLAHRNSP